MFDENPFDMQVIIPIMLSVFKVSLSNDIVLTDSTVPCDTENHSVTFMLTLCGIGDIPLSMFMIKIQTIDK